MKMSDKNCFSANINIKSIDYTTNLSITNQNEALEIELRRNETGETWKGTFDSAYIEELTKKTGNFKSFPIFVNMLKTALKQDSNSVTLDILTFSDLERLRNKKASNSSSIKHSEATGSVNNNKRYLILTYNVEFDRINYPLQLNYQGKVDMNVLLDTINVLKNKISLFEKESNTDNCNQLELNRLRQENEILRKQKEKYELEMQHSIYSDKQDSTQKEVKLLKQMIKMIEEKNLKEKNIYFKKLQQKTKEIETLKAQLEKMRLNERNLKNEIRHLNSQLKINRSRNSSMTKRSSSIESFRSGSFVNDDIKKKNFILRNQDMTKYKPSPSSSLRNKSVSPSPSLRSDSFSSIRSSDSLSKKKTSSVLYDSKLKNERFKQAEQKKRTSLTRRTPQRFNSSNNSARSLSKDNSLLESSFLSNGSHSTKNSKISTKSFSSQRASRRDSKPRAREPNLSSNSYNSMTDMQNKYDKINSSARKKTNTTIVDRQNQNHRSIFDRNEEMKEIDSKLKSLELLIKNNVF